MEKRLEDFVQSVRQLSDLRNLDVFNPIVFRMEHPVTALQYTVIGAKVEPSYLGIPINTSWVVLDPADEYYLQVLKLKDFIDPVTVTNKISEINFAAWHVVRTYEAIFEDAQYYTYFGPEGPIGPTGVPGDIGPIGDSGPVGPTGPIGETGLRGLTGSQGPQGVQGVQGLTGLQGQTGPQGVQGPIGTTGPNGTPGLQGPTGAQGIQGEVGPVGPTGATGQTGQTGQTGAVSTVAGPVGPTGSVGPVGPTGLTGAASTVAGPVGPTGATGAGVAGPVGPTGPIGPYDMTGFLNGKPQASEVILRTIVVRPIVIPANFANSLAKCSVSATVSTVLTITKNGAPVGTITFAAGVLTGVFSTTVQLSYAIGDQLAVVAPASIDATFSDFVITIYGTQV